MTLKQILILGDFDAGLDAHASFQDALADACADAGAVVNTRWHGSDELAMRPGLVAEADGVVLAPRPSRGHREFPAPLVTALRVVRERDIPFLATGDAHDLVLIELARNVLGMERATSTYFDEDALEPVVKELAQPLRPLTNRRPRLMDVDVRHDKTLAPYLPSGRREEAARLTHGLNLDYAYALEEAGLRTAGADAVSRRPCLWVLDGAKWHVSASFLPQLSSRRGAPHPLIAGFAAHAAATGLS